MTPTQNVLAKHFPSLPFKYDYILAPLTYFKIGGPAEAFIEITTREDLQQVVQFCDLHHLKVTMLGGASNVIVADEGITGVVIRFVYNGVRVITETPDEQLVIEAGAGIKMALLVRQTISFGLTGLEYFLGVPGSLGGAVYNNAHYLSQLISEHILQVEVLTDDFEFKWLPKDDCAFGYDSSRFHKTTEIITAVQFSLAKGTPETSQDLIKKATVYRATTQPLGEPSSGCIFQNTPNTPALQKLFPQFADQTHVPGGFIIEQAGLKGETEGGIEVSHKHAAFFVNKGQGTAQQVKKLVQKVKQRVAERFGVELTEEVFYLS